MKKFLLGVCLCAAGALSFAASASAQTYPDRPVRVIVPFGAGSSTDILTRTVAEGLSKRLGQPFVVENRAGAAGAIGTGMAASARPDGYTLIMGTNGPFAANVSLYKDLSYDPIKDFEPVVLMGRLPMILVAPPSAAADTLKGILEEAAENPESVNFGASNTTAQVWAELVKKTGGVDVATVLYSQVGSLMTDLMAGRISYAFENVGPTRPLIESGKLKALAVTSAERVEFMPDVPTMIESGLDKARLDVWFALFAPKDTPQDIVNLLNTEVNALLDTGELRQVAGQISMSPAGGPPADLADYHPKEVENWRQLIELTGVEVN